MLKFDLKFYILVYIKILESLDMFVGGFEAGRIEQNLNFQRGDDFTKRPRGNSNVLPLGRTFVRVGLKGPVQSREKRAIFSRIKRAIQ